MTGEDPEVVAEVEVGVEGEGTLMTIEAVGCVTGVGVQEGVDKE